jgi:hypothetical protein
MQTILASAPYSRQIAQCGSGAYSGERDRHSGERDRGSVLRVLILCRRAFPAVLPFLELNFLNE